MSTTVTTTDDKKPLSPVAAFKQVLSGNQREQIAAQLPRGIDVDRFIRTAMTVVSMNPELLTCTMPSLMGSIMLAAKDGLLPDGKEAVIQPYNCKVSKPNEKPDRWEKQAQYMPMVRGLINILYRTGDVAMVDGVAVRQKDTFEYERGDLPRIVHKPYMGADDAGPVIAAYCIIKLNNGEVKREVMNARDIATVRSMSKSKNGPGWNNWEDQFAIKAVIKRAFKQLPTDSEDLSRVIEHDNQAMQFDLEQDTTQPLKVEHKPGQPSRLKAIMSQGDQKEEVLIEENRQHPQQQNKPQQPAAEEPYFGDDTPNLDECPEYDR
jgi:recombination protein RecT